MVLFHGSASGWLGDRILRRSTFPRWIGFRAPAVRHSPAQAARRGDGRFTLSGLQGREKLVMAGDPAHRFEGG
jgi:hypothetical protein